MKSRLTLADVLAEVRDLRSLVLDMRLINIFDVDEKTFLLKFAQHETKHILLIESGIRIHTTLYARDKPIQPSPFTMKLRKHLRNKRLTSITQVGVDRVVDLAFGSGELTHHLILELYDKGNVVLTDGDYTILSLLRGYTLEVGGKAEAEGDAGPEAAGTGGTGVPPATATAGGGTPQGPAAGDRVRIAVKAKYAWAANTNLLRTAAIDNGSESVATGHVCPLDATRPPPALAHALALYISQYEVAVLPTLAAKARKKLTLSALLCSKGSGIDVYGPMLVEHALATATGTGGGTATLASLRAKGWVPPKADPKDKTGAVPVLSTEAYLSSYDPESLLNVATALTSLPALLHRLGTVPEAGYALVQPLHTGGTATQGLDSLMAGMNMSSDAPTPVKPISSIVFPPGGGCIGTWQEVQEKARQGMITQAGSTHEATDPAPMSTSAAAGIDAASATAPSTAVAEEDSLGAGGTQLPPTLPFTMVDLTPALLAQHAGASYVSFPSFDSACDAYFSRLDVARAEKAESQAKAAAAKRLARIKEGHAENLHALSQAQQLAYRKARLLERWVEDVDKACLVVRSALEHGVKWIDLLHLVEAEQARGNPIAKLIVPSHMDLGRGRITVALVDVDAVEEEREVRREERSMARRLQGLDSDSEGEEGEDEEEQEDSEAQDGDGESDRDSNDDSAAAGVDSAGKARKSGAAGASSGGKAKGSGGKGQREQASGTGTAAGSKGKEKGREKAEAAIAQRMTGSKHSLLIEVDVLQTTAANASAYYAVGKGAREKEARTLQVVEQAIKRAEKSVAAAAAREIAAASASRAIRVARKPSWFERFHWFITSEGLICVAGKSAEDNELLWRKYLRPQDAYVHADAHGAATVVLRNISTDPASVHLLPPLSLQQAGAFCICLSSAWGGNTPTGAWWVKAEQVSKTAPTGEYLTTGSFMIRGKKNPLPPARLELGLCLVWKVEEVCVDRHVGDRRVRGAIGDVDQAAQMTGADDDEGSGEDEVDNKGGPISAEAARRVARRQARRAERESEAAKEQLPASSSAPTVDAPGNVPEGMDEQGEGDGLDAADEPPSGSEQEEEQGVSGDATRAEAEAEAEGGTPRGILPAHIKRAAKKLEKKGLSADAAVQQALAAEASKKKGAVPARAAGSASEDDEEEGGGQDAGGGKKAATAGSKQTQAKRGQRGKLKKAKEKYGDQDEEDREVALLALGHKGAAPPAPTVVQPKDEGAVKTDTNQAPAVPAKKAPKPGLGREKGKGKGDTEGAGEGEAEENTNQDETRLLASLVAWPAASDILLHAIPMLCPYSVAITAKYRCKLTPGPLKKGKAGQAVLHIWTQTARAPPAGQGTERERELLRTIGDTELVAALVGGCRVTAAPHASGPAGAAAGVPGTSSK